MQRLKRGGHPSGRSREGKKIKEAQGQAEAIRTVQKATAEGIRYIREAGSRSDRAAA